MNRRSARQSGTIISPEFEEAIKENRKDLIRKRRIIMYGINLPVLVVCFTIAPIIAIFVGSDDYHYFYQASVFQTVFVIMSLMIFTLALFRINKTVKGIEGAFQNRFYTMLHFGLVISVMLFNIGYLVYNFFSLKYIYDGSECVETAWKAFYGVSILSYFWDVLEMFLDLLILYIMLSLTEPIEEHSDSVDLEDILVDDADLSPNSRKQRQAMLDAMRERD